MEADTHTPWAPATRALLFLPTRLSHTDPSWHRGCAFASLTASVRKRHHCGDVTFSYSRARHFLLTAPTFTLKLYVPYMTVKNNHCICSGVLGTKLCRGKAIREQNKVVVHAANGQSTTIFYQDNLQQAQHLLIPGQGQHCVKSSKTTMLSEVSTAELRGGCNSLDSF